MSLQRTGTKHTFSATLTALVNTNLLVNLPVSLLVLFPTVSNNFTPTRSLGPFRCPTYFARQIFHASTAPSVRILLNNFTHCILDFLPYPRLTSPFPANGTDPDADEGILRHVKPRHGAL